MPISAEITSFAGAGVGPCADFAPLNVKEALQEAARESVDQPISRAALMFFGRT